MDRVALTGMMHHNHRTNAHEAVKHDQAPQGIGGGAASGIADDGGFCGRSIPFGSFYHIDVAGIINGREAKEV